MSINYLIGRKMGMTRLFDELGIDFPVTVLEVGPCYISQIKTLDNDGYCSVQICFSDKSVRKSNRPERGHFGKANLDPKRYLSEVRVENAEGLNLGQQLGANIFSLGDLVTVSGVSKGKGFAGHMKRHGFGGGRKTHGSKFHRGLGSTGQSATPSKVFKGKKMPGRMGGKSSTVHNLKVFSVDIEKNLLVLGGSVPGRRDGMVIVTSAKKDGSNIPIISLMQTDNVEKETKTEVAE